MYSKCGTLFGYLDWHRRASISTCTVLVVPLPPALAHANPEYSEWTFDQEQSYRICVTCLPFDRYLPRHKFDLHFTVHSNCHKSLLLRPHTCTAREKLSSFAKLSNSESVPSALQNEVALSTYIIQLLEFLSSPTPDPHEHFNSVYILLILFSKKNKKNAVSSRVIAHLTSMLPSLPHLARPNSSPSNQPSCRGSSSPGSCESHH